jgi:peptide/nickel transport system substrate-binding protein
MKKNIVLLSIFVFVISAFFISGCERKEPAVEETLQQIDKKLGEIEKRIEDLGKKDEEIKADLEELKRIVPALERVEEAVPKPEVRKPEVAAVYGGTLRVALEGEPPGLDPTTNPSAIIDRVMYNNLFEGLVKFDRDGRIVPGLARSWDISKDGKVYAFHLERGVKFHNGQPFTAADVKYTLDLAGDPEHKTKTHKEYYKDIGKVEAVDEHTVRVALNTVNSMFFYDLARGDSVILPKDMQPEMKTSPVGTGPFKFKEWVKGDHVTLVKNPEYYRQGVPYLDEVIFKFIDTPPARNAALKAGDIDVIGYLASPETAIEFDKDPGLKVFSGVTTGDVIMSTNNSRKPFSDVRVRRAMAYAIDRQAIIDGAMFGYGTPIGTHTSPINPNYVDLTWMHPYNPEKAKQLLAEAGYPNGFDAVIKLAPRYDYSKRSGEIIADQFKKVGINLKIELIEWGQWIDRVYRNADYDLTVIGHVEAFDIGIYANPKYYFRYDSPKFQEIIRRARGSTDLGEQSRLYAVAQYILADDAVNGFLFEAPSLPAMKKEVMGWWENYPAIAHDVTEVWIAK